MSHNISQKSKKLIQKYCIVSSKISPHVAETSTHRGFYNFHGRASTAFKIPEIGLNSEFYF